jgi:hypothetical protein
MSFENWQKGYHEVKNVIHNEVGVTRQDILDVFRKIAKEELQKIVHEKNALIKDSIREVIREEMIKVVEGHDYPKVRKSIWNYGGENSFKDYITGVMQKEIMDKMYEQFDFNLDIHKK